MTMALSASTTALAIALFEVMLIESVSPEVALSAVLLFEMRVHEEVRFEVVLCELHLEAGQSKLSLIFGASTVPLSLLQPQAPVGSIVSSIDSWSPRRMLRSMLG
jgi:hypothetical protein